MNRSSPWSIYAVQICEVKLLVCILPIYVTSIELNVSPMVFTESMEYIA